MDPLRKRASDAFSGNSTDWDFKLVTSHFTFYILINKEEK